MNHKLLALYGLKFNPFSPDLPVEAIYVPPRLENFCWRVENAQVRDGGFAMVHGDPGTGKSVALRLLADLYRELGDVFAVPLKPHNRWGGFKTLRQRRLAHMEATRRRAVLLVDEAQEMSPPALCELRLLASARFDSQPLLCDHTAGNYRILSTMGAELLATAAQRELPQLDEQLYLEVFDQPPTATARRTGARR